MVEQRKSRRFEMRLPVRLLRRDSTVCDERGETRNLSSRGVLMVASSPMVVGERIEYVISMPAGRGGEPVELRCLGQVVRTGNAEPTSDGLFAVAASLDRYEFVRRP